MRPVSIYYKPDETPPVIIRELQRIANHVQERCGIAFPPLTVIVECSFASSPRNYAGIVQATGQMHVCEELAEQQLSRVRGILYHEMGHVLQWLEEQLTGRCELGGRDYEQDCDYKLEAACGVRIYYDEDLVQRAGPGAKGTYPRPAGLK